MTLINIVGEIMRKHTPSLYQFFTRSIYRLKKTDSIYIIDYLGGSFKKYISDNPMQDKLSKLLSGMDDYSERTVRVVYERLLNYPEKSYNQLINPEKNYIIGGFLEEEKAYFNIKKVKKENKFKINKRFIESSIFQYYHGLILLPKEVNQYLNGGDFIDIGAYVGESALALKKYNYKKIYSIEMSKVSITRYLKTMKKNNIGDDKFELINYAIAKEEGLPPIIFADSGSAGLSVKRENPTKDTEIQIQQKTLDGIVRSYNIKPVFIKLDVEGSGMDCVLGGLQTIKTFRPILSIAIYHNPIEFFEIKPLLESELANYTFIIRKISNTIKDNFCHAETVLLAYPNEIKI